MGYICDFCGDQRSMVYCRSDAACLCLSCDRNVHSANALSKRHSRTLLCERCNSQPAFVRCVEEKISLCQNCDWLGHGTSTSSSTHKRQAINCYSGCPSAAELSSIWSFVLEIAAISESTCEQELGLMSINENKCVGVPPEDQNVSGSDEVTDLPALNKSLVGASLMPESSSEPCILDQPAGPTNECLPKLYCPATKCPALSEDDNLYDDFNMDEVDLDLENYEELFGMALSHSEELFENGGIDSLFGTKGMSAGDSNCQEAIAAEGSSVGQVNAMQPACSNAASADSILSTKTEPILCFTGRQTQSNLSFSGVTGESSAGDYQDCGASSMLLMGEPPWFAPCPENSLQSANRSNALHQGGCVRPSSTLVSASPAIVNPAPCPSRTKRDPHRKRMIANGHRELASVGNTSRCGGFLTQGSATRTTCGGTTKGSGTLQGGALLNHYFTIRIDLEISPFSSPSSFYQCRRRTLLHR